VSPARCRIAILGCGTVGSAVARRLTAPHAPPGLELTHIVDRRADDKSHTLPSAARVRWTSSVDEVLIGDVDVVIEAVGGIEPAANWIRASLLAGKSVVTANKQVVARQARHCSRWPSVKDVNCGSRRRSAARCRSSAPSATASPAIASRASSPS
jgi:homoserine dehydrogenase